MKGWELLKEIAEGNIEEGTKIIGKTKSTEDTYKFDGDDIINTYNEEFLTSDMSIAVISNSDFELIEEQEEINIQDIEEMEEFSKDELFYVGICENRSVINTIIQAIKQLDREIKENK